MPTVSGVVWGRPLTWGTAANLHTAFALKTSGDEILVKCDFLCYVRWGDDVSVEGSFRSREPRITDHRTRGRYLEAVNVRNTNLDLTFSHP